ncbi:MAG: hypothetical protein AB2462_10035 [Thermoanaerobacter sp.]|jgi:hypothetical protein|uniref:hypothetical protein n=1 Tax=Thermoanaerobacter sp. TaxID=1755 RepID=UPI003464895C
MKKELIVFVLFCLLIFSGCQQFNLNDKGEYNSTLMESNRLSETLHNEENPNDMDANSEACSDYSIVVEGLFAGRSGKIEIKDDTLARELLKVIHTRDELLPESYVRLPYRHEIKIICNGNVIQEVDISWADETCCVCYYEGKAPSYYVVLKVPTDLALRIENHMLDNYLTIRGFFGLEPPIVLSYERISKISIKSLITGNAYFGNYEKDSNKDIIERFVSLYNQLLSIYDEDLEGTYLTEREKDVLSGKRFDADYKIEVLFENGEKLELMAGNEKGIFRVIFRGEEYIIQNHELYMYLKALSNAETKKPNGKYIRVVTYCGEVLIYDNALAEEFYKAIKNEENYLEGGFNCPFGVYIQIKENGEVVNEFRITGPSYLGEDEYIALTTEGINVNIPAFIGTKLESELRKNNYSLSYSN